VKSKAIVLAAVLLPAILQVVPLGGAQEIPATVQAKTVIGLAGVKNNAKGALKVDDGKLVFTHGKEHAEIGAASISDATTGADSERAVGGTLGTVSMVAPYGSGRFLSLFRKKIDTLTIQYRDDDGSLHGTIFTLPVGASENMKKELVAHGAKAEAPGPNQGAHDAAGASHADANAASPSSQTPQKVKTTAVQVRMIRSDEIAVPAEFRVALYENLIAQLQKKGKFQHIYRDGDSNASHAQDLIVLHSSLRGFKQGSERARQVTTVAGATSIKIHCRFTGTDGATILDRDVDGKVRFFGGNLRATYDFAKKAAQITGDNFSAVKSAQ
jgi:hypothetical protein